MSDKDEYFKSQLNNVDHVEQVKEATTVDEMRKEIFRMRWHSHIVRNVCDSAEYVGMSGEDKYAMLSYSLLSSYQQLFAQMVKTELCRITPFEHIMTKLK